MNFTFKIFFCSLALLLVFFQNGTAQNLIPKKDRNNKYGYVDRAESFLIDAEFDKAFSFEKEIAKVIQNGKWALIDNSGRYLVKPKFQYIGWANDGYYRWNSKNLSLTNTLVPPKNVFYPPVGDYYAYFEDDKWGLLNASGKVYKNEWDSIRNGDGGNFAAYKSGSGWTWINKEGKSISDKFYYQVKTLSNGLIAIKRDRESDFSLLSSDGTLISDKDYSKVESLNDDYIKARLNSGWYQLDIKAAPVLEQKFDDIKYIHWNNTMQYLPKSPWLKSDIEINEKTELTFSVHHKYRSDLFLINKEDELFIKNFRNGNEIALNDHDTALIKDGFIFIKNIPNESLRIYDYDLSLMSPILSEAKSIISDSSYFLIKVKDQSNWNLWSMNHNEIVLENIDSRCEVIDSDKLKLYRNGEAGVWSAKNSNWIIDASYSDIKLVNDSLFVIFTKDSSFIRTRSNKNLYSGIFQDAFALNDSLIALKSKENFWTVNNSSGKNLLQQKFKQITSSNGNSVLLKNSNGWKIFSFKLDRYLLSQHYDTIGDLFSEHFLLKKANNWGLINQSGHFTFQMSPYYEQIFPLYEKRWQVYRNDLSGIIDHNGILKISTQYQDFKPLIHGYIPFKFRNRWGLLDLKEHFVLQPLNDSLKFLNPDYVQVWKDGKTGLKNLEDKTLIAIDFDSIFMTRFGTFIVGKNDKYGLYNENGQQIRPVGFDEIRILSKDFVALKKNNYWRLIRSNGNFVSNDKYNNIYYDSVSDQFLYKIHTEWQIVSLD